MTNRLAASTSPYLRQHADNPVHWWEWGEDAFAEARRRRVPVLLSVGYAACHWCHVMAHESFEDDAIAAVMNELFVNVKVDREERPDVDAVYMTATQALTGHGGWPMTCFLTPDGEPFHCGTYYPPRRRHGQPGFAELLTAVSEAWTRRGDEVRDMAGRITAQLADQDWKLTPTPVGAAELDAAVAVLGTQFDRVDGGFGHEPKFPPSMVLEFLLRHHERTGSDHALEMATATCERMARGGLYDQLGGGFARYSVDGRWVVPHFEKMLYDNALLLRCYAHLGRLTGSPLARRVSAETAEFLLGELRTADGGFASSFDADAAGSEGSTYVWTPAQLVSVLGAEDGAWAASVFAVTQDGTFEHGSSVLQLPVLPAVPPGSSPGALPGAVPCSSPGALAGASPGSSSGARPDVAPGALAGAAADGVSADPERFESVRARLLAARASRPQPERDDKVITAWNGLAVTALAEAGAARGRRRWVEAAVDAAELLLRVHLVDGRLRRSSRDGVAGAAMGVLEDYGAFAMGLLALHQATGSARWLDAACSLLDTALANFADPDAPGCFFDTASDAERLVTRPRDPSDNASPSGASVLAEALLTASVLAAPERGTRYREVADAALAAVGALARQAPRFAGHWLTVAEAAATGPLQVAVALAAPVAAAAGVASSGEELLETARAVAPGGTVVVAGPPDAPGVPLLADRPLVDGAAAAYVCRGFVCDLPATTPATLTTALTS